jgi:hypothetical protein
VISDLHFEEEAATRSAARTARIELSVPRNIPAAPYRRLIADLARAAERNGRTPSAGARRRHLRAVPDRPLVHGRRTAAPYQATVEEGSPLEHEAPVDPGRDRRGGSRCGRRWSSSAPGVGTVPRGAEEKEFPVPASIEYIPGNHDRPQRHAAIRRKVRRCWGWATGAERFPNYLLLENPSALIRHGHEYDPTTSRWTTADAERIPLHIPREHYDGPTFGDFITIDVVARLPVEFRGCTRRKASSPTR